MEVGNRFTCAGLIGSLVWLLGALASTAQGASPVHQYCTDLLTQRDSAGASVDVAGAPGLRILSSEIVGVKPEYKAMLHHETDAYHPHELVSSARYARLISEHSHETLLMVPGIDHRSVPGFDGIILDAKGEPIANFSLKTLLSTKDEHSPMNRARTGVEKAEKFSFMDKWLVMLRLFVADERGSLHVAHILSKGEESLTKRWLAKAARLFGVSDEPVAKRPTRIVVDITTSSPMPDEADVATVRSWIKESGGLIESVTFLKDDAVLEVR